MCHFTPFPRVLKRTMVVFWLHGDVIRVYCLDLDRLSVCTPQLAFYKLSSNEFLYDNVASIATNSSYRRLLSPVEIEMP